MPEMPAPAIRTSKCSVVAGTAARTGLNVHLSLIFLFVLLAACEPRHRSRAAPRAAECRFGGERRRPLEQVYVLLVLQQRTVQRQDQLARIALPEHFGRDVLVQQLQPVEQLRRRWLLLPDPALRALRRRSAALLPPAASSMPGKCTSTIRPMVSASGNLM